MPGPHFYSHLDGEDGSSPHPEPLVSSAAMEVGVESGDVNAGPEPDVRVDDPMDRRVPDEAEDLEVLGPSYRVGPHLCHRTAGDSRMTCTKCGRYVTSYKGTWRNLGTLAKQPCKPKARRRKGYEGKAAHKQSGGALPAPPPGSRARGRAPGPNKKARVSGSLYTTPAQPASSSDTHRQLGLEHVAPVALAEEPGGSLPLGGSEEPGGSSDRPDVSTCALCGDTFLELQLQDRTIRSQRLRVCSHCVTAHPKTLPRRSDSPSEAGACSRRARDSGGPGGPPGKRSRLL
eukprot:5272809-Amphidinium_carterae.1